MDRIGPAGGSPTATLTNGQQGFVDENLSAGTEGTTVVAEWMNAVQEELMSILAAAGTTPNIANFGQVLSSLHTLFGGAGAMSATSAWTKLPGGLILQCGSGVFAANNQGTAHYSVVFPTTFPTGAIAVVGSAQGSANTSGDQPAWGCQGISASGFLANIDTLSSAYPINQNVGFSYIALGY